MTKKPRPAKRASEAAKKIAARIPKPKKKVTWPQLRAFSVHVLTASGSFLAFLSIVAASEKQWNAMFLWLGLALLVDGIDGPIARKLSVKSVLPTWSGETLDNVIDYTTYVIIPAFALYQRGFMGEGLSFLSGAIIVITSAIYYADTGMKTKENFFKGFPVVWNMVVFTLFIIEPGEWVAFAIVLLCGILTFLPVNFLHPVRVRRLRPLNLAMTFAWCGFGRSISVLRCCGVPSAPWPSRKRQWQPFTTASAYSANMSTSSPRSASPPPASICSASARSCRPFRNSEPRKRDITDMPDLRRHDIRAGTAR